MQGDSPESSLGERAGAPWGNPLPVPCEALRSPDSGPLPNSFGSRHCGFTLPGKHRHKHFALQRHVRPGLSKRFAIQVAQRGKSALHRLGWGAQLCPLGARGQGSQRRCDQEGVGERVLCWDPLLPETAAPSQSPKATFPEWGPELMSPAHSPLLWPPWSRCRTTVRHLPHLTWLLFPAAPLCCSPGALPALYAPHQPKAEALRSSALPRTLQSQSVWTSHHVNTTWRFAQDDVGAQVQPVHLPPRPCPAPRLVQVHLAHPIAPISCSPQT